MACGRAVILSSTAGLWNPDALANGDNLCLVPAGDVDALAAAMDRAVSDPAWAARLGQRGRDYALRHGDIRDFARRIEAGCRQAAGA